MVIVFGSINLDLVTRVPNIPAPGETVVGPSYAVIPGGKGANQALAARRAGAAVAFVGAVGRDPFAEAAVALLRAELVSLAAVATVDAPTGAAFIAVDPRAENAIVVAAGANGRVRAAQLDNVALAKGDVLLLQREVPDSETWAAARLAKRNGAQVVLNLAPAGPVAPDDLRLLDALILNEHEAVILGTALGIAETSPEAIARSVEAQFAVPTIVTLGAQGAVGFSGGTVHRIAAPSVAVVDTTAAGDAFVGAFAAALDHDLTFVEAMANGVAAGSLACMRDGAQPSLPSVAEIQALARSLMPDPTAPPAA